MVQRTRVSAETPIPSVQADQEDDLPGYAQSLLAYHRAHETTLKAMIDSLPLESGSRVLDLATGDGTYAILLARRGARVVAVDRDERYLAFAKRRASASLPIDFRQGDAFRLPFEDGELDAAFCAQSMYDLGDVMGVVHEMGRVVRPGGWVAIMENDSLHHLVLPWPPDLEIAVQKAQLEALSRESGDETRFYVGRRLASLFREGGFGQTQERSFSTQLTAPLSEDQRTFLQQKLSGLFELVHSRLERSEFERVEALCLAESPECMLNQPDFSATVLDLLVVSFVSNPASSTSKK